MTFGKEDAGSLGSDPTTQAEEISPTEKVALAKLENDLNSLKPENEFPEFDIQNMGDVAKSRAEILIGKAVGVYSKQGTGVGLIVTSKILTWMRQHNLDMEQVGNLANPDHFELQVCQTYEQDIQNHHLKEAHTVQEFFKDDTIDFLSIAEKNKDALKKAALEKGVTGVWLAFQLLPSLESDADLKEDAKKRFEWCVKNNQYTEAEEVIRAYPQDFFTVEEIFPIAEHALTRKYSGGSYYYESYYDGLEKIGPVFFTVRFPVSDEGKKIILDKILDKSIASGAIRFAEELAKKFEYEADLRSKVLATYTKHLREKDSRHLELILKLDDVVPDDVKKQGEVANLRKEWAIQNLAGIIREVQYTFRKGDVGEMKRTYNLSDEFLAEPEVQQKIQQQLLSTLAYGNYSVALHIHEGFLTEPSKNKDFYTQIETLFLSGVQKNKPSLTKGSSVEKLIDLFSDDFKQSPQFRECAQSILSMRMRGNYESDSSEKISFVIEKLGCTHEEIQKAKENALLHTLAYVYEDGSINNLRGEKDEVIKKSLEIIQPDRSVLDAVYAKLKEVVLRGEEVSNVRQLASYERLLGVSGGSVVEEREAKDIVCRNIAEDIHKGKLNQAVETAKNLKLSNEDLKTIEKKKIMDGVVWWLSAEFKNLHTYGVWKHVDENIERFIDFFQVSQEDLMQNQEIRELGGILSLAGRTFYSSSGIEDILTKKLLITNEDMMLGVDEVLELILEKKKELKDRINLFAKVAEILPELPEDFADETISWAFLSTMSSYPIEREDHYDRRKCLADHLVEHMNALHTFEAKQNICTQAFMRIVDNGKFNEAHNLLEKRNALPYVAQEVRQEMLVPEYIRILTSNNERAASTFAENFKLNIKDISDERVNVAYQQIFKTAVSQKNIYSIVTYAKKVELPKELLDSPDIQEKLQEAFVEYVSKDDSETAMKLIVNDLLSRDFIQSNRVQEVAKSRVPELLSEGRFKDIVALNSQLALNITPQDIIALDPEKAKFFEKLDADFPELSKKCHNSLEALFSLWPHIHLLDSGILEKFPFLAKALEENDRFGVKLLLKFRSLDKLSQANIEFLYKNKDDIVHERKSIDVESRDFRIATQDRLNDYRRNAEITASLRKSGIDVEEWLNHEDEIYFALGKDKNEKYSQTIVTPIERIQETIDSYTEAVKEVLGQYKNELIGFKVPPKDISLLQVQLEKLKEQRQIAERDGDAKKVEGITKGISAIENQISKAKDIPLWDKVFGNISLLDLVKKDIFKAYSDLCEVEIELEKKEADTDTPLNQKRKEFLKLKNKIDSLKKEIQKKVQLLGNRLAEFDDELFTLVSPALGEERSRSLIQEKNEQAQEHIDHYQSDSKTLENLFYEKMNRGLVGQHMKIGLWNRNPDRDLYLGNYTDCCIRIDSEHMGAESTIADYLTDVGVQVVVVTDEKKDIPVVAAWCWVGHDDNDQVAFVVDNIEANTDYSANFRAQLEEKLKEFLQNYAKKVGAKLVQGRKNNDLIVAKMDSAYFKIGGYNRPSGYFLEGEDESYFADEHEHEHWDEDVD